MFPQREDEEAGALPLGVLFNKEDLSFLIFSFSHILPTKARNRMKLSEKLL